MSYRQGYRRVAVLLLAMLLMVGCGIGSQEAEVPDDVGLPIETPAADEGAPTVESAPTAAPAEPANYRVVSIPQADLQVEVPDSWIVDGSETVWTPAAGDERRVGVSVTDLVPPQEPEAVLLPTPAQTLESEAIETALGVGRQFKLEVYETAPEGDDAKADVVSVEMHVLVVVPGDDGRTGYDFYAAAPTAEALETVLPVLSRMATTAKLGSLATAPQDETLTYQVVSVPQAGMQVEIPDSWIVEGAETSWSPASGDGRRVGVIRADLVPPQEAEAVLLPAPGQTLESEAVETALGAGRQFKLEVYKTAPEGDDAKADVASVEMHVLVVVSGDDGRTGYDFFAAAPTAEALESVLPALSRMVATAKLEPVAGQPVDGYDNIAAVAAAKTRLAEHLSVAEDAVRVISAEAKDWSDACIGIHDPGQMCAQVITPGYLIMAEVDGQTYELHTNASGSVVGIVP